MPCLTIPSSWQCQQSFVTWLRGLKVSNTKKFFQRLLSHHDTLLFFGTFHSIKANPYCLASFQEPTRHEFILSIADNNIYAHITFTKSIDSHLQSVLLKGRYTFMTKVAPNVFSLLVYVPGSKSTACLLITTATATTKVFFNVIHASHSFHLLTMSKISVSNPYEMKELLQLCRCCPHRESMAA